MEKNYYQILGVNPNATSEEIKNAFRLYASKFHPDKHKGDDFFSNQFKLIKEAYDTLSDPEKRNEYDRDYFRKKTTQKSDTHSSTSIKNDVKVYKYQTSKSNSWKLSWKYYLGLAIAVFLFFELLTPKAEDFVFGWSEEEISSHIRSCRGSADSFKDEHDFDDYEVNFYCACTQREIVSLFPKAPPTLQELNRQTVENITSKCFNEAISTRN